MQALIAFLAVAGANFLFIGLKAFQQRNVIHDNYSLVVLTSSAMAFFEVYVVASIAKYGVDLWLVVALATGGSIGCLLAMMLHKRLGLSKGSTR